MKAQKKLSQMSGLCLFCCKNRAQNCNETCEAPCQLPTGHTNTLINADMQLEDESLQSEEHLSQRFDDISRVSKNILSKEFSESFIKNQLKESKALRLEKHTLNSLDLKNQFKESWKTYSDLFSVTQRLSLRYCENQTRESLSELLHNQIDATNKLLMTIGRIDDENFKSLHSIMEDKQVTPSIMRPWPHIELNLDEDAMECNIDPIPSLGKPRWCITPNCLTPTQGFLLCHSTSESPNPNTLNPSLERKYTLPPLPTPTGFLSGQGNLFSHAECVDDQMLDGHIIDDAKTRRRKDSEDSINFYGSCHSLFSPDSKYCGFRSDAGRENWKNNYPLKSKESFDELGFCSDI